MKSVVAEASSISKAIELAWQKAGQPKEFLVKVFQEPQRNMFGLTKTSAKVGIFFDDAVITQKIKNASQSSQPAVHTAKQISPIVPIKPIVKPIEHRPQTPKQVKPQPKVEIKPAEPANQIAGDSVNKNIQTAKTNINRRNNPNNKPAQTARPTDRPNASNSTRTSNEKVANPMPANSIVDLPSEQSLVEQVISLIANEKNSKIVSATPSNTNTNPTSNPTPPRTARNKYYHRRKPRAPRPGSDNKGPETTTAATSKKSED